MKTKLRILSAGLMSAFSVAFLSGCTDKPVGKTGQGEAVDTVKTTGQYYDIKKGEKPSPDQALEMLRLGNERFVKGKTAHPHSDSLRVLLANKENQGDYAIATVLSCSDSRVPVEMLFDAGIMDIFVVRVAGNVADTDEIGTIEYGVCHVKTPLLLVLGHTKCGAVTAVAHALEGKGHELEFNIPPLVDNIIPAVKKVIGSHEHGHEADIVPLAIEENVWQSVHDILLKSAAVREKVKAGSLKIAGAVYNLETGKTDWLPGTEVDKILLEVEKNPKKNKEVLAHK